MYECVWVLVGWLIVGTLHEIAAPMSIYFTGICKDDCNALGTKEHSEGGRNIQVFCRVAK